MTEVPASQPQMFYLWVWYLSHFPGHPRFPEAKSLCWLQVFTRALGLRWEGQDPKPWVANLLWDRCHTPILHLEKVTCPSTLQERKRTTWFSLRVKSPRKDVPWSLVFRKGIRSTLQSHNIIKQIVLFHTCSHGDTEVRCVGKPGESGRIGEALISSRTRDCACTAAPGQQN